MYNGGGFYNQYVGSPETEWSTRPTHTPTPTPKPNPPRREEPVARPPPRPTMTYPPYQPRAPPTLTRPSSGNGALIAQLGILAVIALFMFMKLNSS